jgi:hypothetical protein
MKSHYAQLVTHTDQVTKPIASAKADTAIHVLCKMVQQIDRVILCKMVPQAVEVTLCKAGDCYSLFYRNVVQIYLFVNVFYLSVSKWGYLQVSAGYLSLNSLPGVSVFNLCALSRTQTHTHTIVARTLSYTNTLISVKT